MQGQHLEISQSTGVTTDQANRRAHVGFLLSDSYRD